MKMKRWRTVLLVLVCVGLGFAFRFGICVRDVNRLKSSLGVDFAPFQAESAVAYAQVRAFADGRSEAGVLATGSLAELDADAQLMSGMERFLGWTLAARRLAAGSPAVDPERSRWEDNPDDARWVRLMLALWIATLPGWLFLWLRWSGVPNFWALAAALFYIVMPSAVARYTGQELLKGAFALPFIAAWLAFYALTLKTGLRRYLAGTALAAFLAAANWDMAQVLLGAWALCEIVRRLAGGKADPLRAKLLITGWIGVLLAAVLLPYGRIHGSVLSPVVLVIFPWAILLNAREWRWYGRWGAGLVLAGLWLLLARHSNFAGNYDHFLDLILAKLRFGNVKPADPELLTFSQRFLWTPGLNSADLRLVLSYFPGIFWLAVLAMAGGFCSRKWRAVALPEARFWGPCAGLGIGFFIVFLFLVRFHEMASLFIAAWFGWMLWCWFRAVEGRKVLRGLVLAVALAALIWEAACSLRGRAYGYRKVEVLAVEAARAGGLAGQVVLADMETGSVLAGYAGCRLVVQPKFELPEVRAAAEEYVHLLFLGNEEEMARFCEKHQVRYLFFRRRTALQDLNPGGYRYMAAARTIPSDAVARVFDRPDNRLRQLRHFRRLELPQGIDPDTGEYLRIFRYVTREDRMAARDLAMLAYENHLNGRSREARQWIAAACKLDPLSLEWRELYFTIAGEAPPPPGL